MTEIQEGTLATIEPFGPQPLTKAQLKVLMQDLKRHRISSRSQGGRSLSYLEAWDVKAMLIRVFGFGGFSAECIDTKVLDVSANKDGKHQVTVMCTVRLTIHQTGAVYTETAAAMQTGPQLGEVTDFAIKTAESDALKRAAIYLGTQFGLSLYNQGSVNDVVMVVVAPGQEVSPSTGLSEQQQADAATSLGLNPASTEAGSTVEEEPA